jgi:hypothetical protein
MRDYSLSSRLHPEISVDGVGYAGCCGYAGGGYSGAEREAV